MMIHSTNNSQEKISSFDLRNLRRSYGREELLRVERCHADTRDHPTMNYCVENAFPPNKEGAGQTLTNWKSVLFLLMSAEN